jgi:membrane protein required for colicin V production
MTPVAPGAEPHWIDFVVLGLLGVSGLVGVMRGLTREVLGLGCWAGAVALAVFAHPLLQEPLASWIRNPRLQAPVAMGLVFLGSMVVLTFLARQVASLIQSTLLAGLDRTLGFVFGLVRGGFVLCAVYAGVMLMVTNRPALWRKARLEPALAWGAACILRWCPEGVLDRLSGEPARALVKPQALSPEQVNRQLFDTLMRTVPVLPVAPDLLQDIPEETAPEGAPEENLPPDLQTFLDEPQDAPSGEHKSQKDHSFGSTEDPDSGTKEHGVVPSGQKSGSGDMGVRSSVGRASDF